MVRASQGDPTMQITITIREIANGFLVSDQYGELHGYHDARPIETFYDSSEAMLVELPVFAARAMKRQQERDEAYRRMMENEQRDFGKLSAPMAQRSAPAARGYQGQPIGWSELDRPMGATPPDDGDPHNVVVDEGAEFIHKPVMDTSAFGQRDEGPAEK
jgi:hypothetical protein